MLSTGGVHSLGTVEVFAAGGALSAPEQAAGKDTGIPTSVGESTIPLLIQGTLLVLNLPSFKRQLNSFDGFSCQ